MSNKNIHFKSLALLLGQTSYTAAKQWFPIGTGDKTGFLSLWSRNNMTEHGIPSHNTTRCGECPQRVVSLGMLSGDCTIHPEERCNSTVWRNHPSLDTHCSWLPRPNTLDLFWTRNWQLKNVMNMAYRTFWTCKETLKQSRSRLLLFMNCWNGVPLQEDFQNF